MGFLSLFMPQLHWIGSSWNLTAAPSALLCFSMRYLVWRLMFGFGKVRRDGGQINIAQGWHSGRQ